jgi:hypothetical protein
MCFFFIIKIIRTLIKEEDGTMSTILTDTVHMTTKMVAHGEDVDFHAREQLGRLVQGFNGENVDFHARELGRLVFVVHGENVDFHARELGK